MFLSLLEGPVLMWEPSTMSNHSYPITLPPPAQLKARCPLRLHLLIRTPSPTPVPAGRNKPLTSMLYITMLEVHLSRSLLAVPVLQNFLHNTPVDLKINLLLSPPPVLPTTLTLLKGDHDLVPPPVNPKLASSSRSISWLSGLVSQGVYLCMNFIPIFGASYRGFRGCTRPFPILVFIPSTNTVVSLSSTLFLITLNTCTFTLHILAKALISTPYSWNCSSGPNGIHFLSISTSTPPYSRPEPVCLG